MSVDTSYEGGTLIVTRHFNAPRQAVFNAWIETSKVELWWGCSYATKVESEIEPCVGGRYSHLMQLKDVGPYRHHGIITDYDPPALLAYDLHDPLQSIKMTVRVEFSEVDSGTQVRLTQKRLPDEYAPYVMAGWSAALEGLASLLRGEVVVRPH